MWYGNLFEELKSLQDSERAVSMAAYMRNQFPFLGIAATPRKLVAKSYFRIALQEHIIDFDFVEKCFQQQEREYQQLAVDYLLSIQNLLTPEDLNRIKKYIVTKSWWDTVDGLDGVVGSMTLRYPELKKVMVEWSQTDNIWLRRVAIDHQLLFKNKTDTLLLAEIITNNFGTKEFFINKAIGWSLRDYSKTNPQWVKDFIQKHSSQMAPLSIREGSKYL
ncbi:DNA alkylation repair protein [Jeotgalibaca porci]|uniref:DNA alkylation repair protein n=1 Tax=Jeotgalibaca porci TaxID=1868793 RepID=A0A6G7WH44_9LACT|nr:DNA alkylation repair protein [Jeotgalibaca porci]NLB98177.1 DNA alkylation repair protein [Lactobacillales bacterium]QIK51560.1 DNA alkylation repair protein [Jeotgalibaca porci]